ncbi:hypothetical protein F5887DRAFT_1076282 [Amanita rubescens]|nr:hypothetical protein F5887DRAFT_1076282 [Amanita rubescens]
MMLLPFYALLYFALLSCAEPAPPDSRPVIVDGTNHRKSLLNPNAPEFHTQVQQPIEGFMYRINYGQFDKFGKTAPRGFDAFYTGPVPDDSNYALVSSVSFSNRLPQTIFKKGNHDYRQYLRKCVKEEFVEMFKHYQYQFSQTNVGLAQVVRTRDLRKIQGPFLNVELSEDALKEIREATGRIDLSLDVHDLTYHSERLLGQT